MNYRYVVIVNDKLLGVGVRQPTLIDGVAYEPPHYAFCCSTCGEVWARCIAEGSKGPWQFTPWLCEKCGIGTIWINGVKHHNQALPVEALEREFLIGMEYPDAFYFGGWARKDRHFRQPLDSEPESPESEEELTEARAALASF